jgi:hypothetical protein
VAVNGMARSPGSGVVAQRITRSRRSRKNY